MFVHATIIDTRTIQCTCEVYGLCHL